jgi:hypothetical protein
MTGTDAVNNDAGVDVDADCWVVVAGVRDGCWAVGAVGADVRDIEVDDEEDEEPLTGEALVVGCEAILGES